MTNRNSRRRTSYGFGIRRRTSDGLSQSRFLARAVAVAQACGADESHPMSPDGFVAQGGAHFLHGSNDEKERAHIRLEEQVPCAQSHGEHVEHDTPAAAVQLENAARLFGDGWTVWEDTSSAWQQAAAGGLPFPSSTVQTFYGESVTASQVTGVAASSFGTRRPTVEGPLRLLQTASDADVNILFNEEVDKLPDLRNDSVLSERPLSFTYQGVVEQSMNSTTSATSGVLTLPLEPETTKMGSISLSTRHPSSRPETDLDRCVVSTCQASLATDKAYCRRYRLCSHCIALPSVTVDNQMKRFCQQCSLLHPISEFQGDKRSCRAKLAKHAARLRARRAYHRCIQQQQRSSDLQ